MLASSEIEMAGLHSPGFDLLPVFCQVPDVYVCGNDVALFYPIVHFAFMAAVTFSGIYVKNNSDVVKKQMYCCVYHLCDFIPKNVFQLYCM